MQQKKITSLSFVEPTQPSQAPNPSEQFHLKYVTQLHAQGLAKPRNLQLLNECKDEQEAQRMVYVMEALGAVGGVLYASPKKDSDSLTSEEYRKWVQLFQRAFEGYSRNESAESPIVFLTREMSHFMGNDKNLKISHIRKLFNSPSGPDSFLNSITFRNRRTEYSPLSSTAGVLKGTNIAVDVDPRGGVMPVTYGVTARTTIVSRNREVPQLTQTRSSHGASQVVSPDSTKSKSKKRKKRNKSPLNNQNASMTIKPTPTPTPTQTPKTPTPSANSVHTLNPRRSIPSLESKEPKKRKKRDDIHDHGQSGISSRMGGR